jgi:hypothetical protein
MTRYPVYLFLLISCTYIQPEEAIMIPARETLHWLAVEESLEPVHPGIIGKRPFWNTYAQRFIYSPAFDMEETVGADWYLFTASSAVSEETYTFNSGSPRNDLSPIWKDLPVGQITLTVLAMNGEKMIDTAGIRKFHKASAYNGPYRKPDKDYLASVRHLVEYLFNAPYIRYWLINNAPDPGYGLYGYPSKMFSAVIEGMLLYRELDQNENRRDTALAIARIVADHLISISRPAGSPLEFFPPTYTGAVYADMTNEYRGESLADRIMLIYPAVAGKTYLDLYDNTGENRYLDAAVRIAETYVKLQLDNGSWHLLVYLENGKPVARNFVVPTGIVSFLDRLENEHRITGFQSCRDRALSFIEKNVLKDFNWEGQFEDQRPSERYRNLSKGQAVSYAGYIFRKHSGNPEQVRLAEELVRFAEDQFVIWDNRNSIDSWGITSDKWLTPCVLEQYNFYTPVNASSGNMIEVFTQAYEKTGNILYLAKAIDLANTIVDTQNPLTGHYPTYLISDLLDQEGWINCMVYTAKMVYELDRYLKDKNIVLD